MIFILVVLSFLFESAITNIVSINSIFIPLFVLTSLIILYPYFKNKNSFMITCVICGFFYDIAFSDSLFINAISFGISSFFIILIYNYLKYNIYNSNFISILTIVIYRFISYLLLVIVDYTRFSSFSLIRGIYSSIVINMFYGIIIYIISNLISKKFNIQKQS